MLIIIVVTGARGLIAADIVSNTSDPYCVVKVGKVEHKTPVVKKTLEPKWGTSFTMYVLSFLLSFPSFIFSLFFFFFRLSFLFSYTFFSPVMNAKTATLEVTVMDHDMIGSDDFLGYLY